MTGSEVEPTQAQAVEGEVFDRCGRSHSAFDFVERLLTWILELTQSARIGHTGRASIEWLLDVLK